MNIPGLIVFIVMLAAILGCFAYFIWVVFKTMEKNIDNKCPNCHQSVKNFNLFCPYCHCDLRGGGKDWRRK
jgi:hypothetical protein